MDNQALETIQAIGTTLCVSLDEEQTKLLGSNNNQAFGRHGFQADSGNAHEMLHFMERALTKDKLALTMLVIWLLGTWWGTFLLCGYCTAFVHLGPQERERALAGWANSYFADLRMLHKALLSLASLIVYGGNAPSKADNPLWTAIDYISIN